MKSSLEVTFIFQSGRIERIQSERTYAKDMFYTFFNFKNEFKTNIIEFGGFKNKKLNWFLFYFEREIIRRFFKIPLFSTFITNKKNFKIIVNSNHVIMSSHRIACSVLPMIVVSKLKRKKTKFSFFVMGMFASKPKIKIFRVIQTIFFRVLFYFSDNIIFIGKGEFEYAYKNFQYFRKKIAYIPFGIDTDFWKASNNFSFEEKKGVLFVGNDSNRNFELLIQIAIKLKNLNFTFLTNQISQNRIPANVNLIKGSWAQESLTDLELKTLYEKHRLTILPLKESIQPSGQSVALQSMAVGTPVILSKTSGLWDFENLIDQENIIFANSENLNEWTLLIEKNYFNLEKLKFLSVNSINTVSRNLNISNFYLDIKKLLDINN